MTAYRSRNSLLSLFFAVLLVAPASCAQNSKNSIHPAGEKPGAAEKTTKINRHDGIEVESVAFAVGVSSRMPVGSSDTFDASVGTLYFWSRIYAHDVPVQVKHIWYHDDKKAGEIPVTIRYKHTRLWTHHSVDPGLWRVEITNEAGTPVTVAACIVRKRQP